MAQTITEGLFPSVAGLFATPGAEQQARLQAAAQPTNPLQAVSGNIGFLGERMQQGIGARFGQMPEVDRKRQVFQQLVNNLAQQGVDISTPQGMVQLAQQMSSIPGLEGEALGLRQRAAQMAQQAQMQGLEAEKIRAQTAKATAEAEKAGRVTEGGQKGVVLPAGGRIVDPVTGRVIAEGTPQRTEAEKPSAEAKKYNELLALGVDPERARAIAYKTESVDFRRELQAAKQEENRERKSQQQSNIISTIDNIMNTIGTAEKQIGFFTAGTLGSPLSLIPGTGATDLEANLETIKANLGFDRLQQMRDASPTGGALGQVAIQELVALQSTVASLNNKQSPNQLKANLKKIQGHYERWRDAVRKAQEQNQTTIGDLQPSQPAQATQPAQTAPAAAPQAQPQQPRRLRFNPATGRVE
jgi:hypothetical protein